jgi:hypothetical protein
LQRYTALGQVQCRYVAPRFGLQSPGHPRVIQSSNYTAGCNTSANVHTPYFFSETSFETELNHKWQVHGISIIRVFYANVQTVICNNVKRISIRPMYGRSVVIFSLLPVWKRVVPPNNGRFEQRRPSKDFKPCEVLYMSLGFFSPQGYLLFVIAILRILLWRISTVFLLK